jgi:hypothetical protein
LASIVDTELLRRLERAQILFCMIGASALAVHGYVRTTADIDLLTTDTRVLADAFWEGAPVTVRRGDWDDPLAGSVIWPSTIKHDVVVGRGYAAAFALSTAKENVQLGCKVAEPLALILLKLEAGGAQDLYDVVALIQTRSTLDGAILQPLVEEQLAKLSAEARDAWKRMQTILK